MIGATVCSGIGAPEVAMPWVEWRFAAEVDAAARAVYAFRHPGTELMGDFTGMKDDPRIVDVELLVGGTPCQAFSIAGLRQSLSDDRGNLSLEFIRLANAIDDLRRADGRNDAFILWENVPGVLSVSDNAFGAFLGGLVGSDAPLVPRGRWANAGVVAGPRRIAAWRILDAQFFGVPQRRRRVFVLAHGHSRGWACADALLSIGHSLSGHLAPRREKGTGVAALTANGVGTCGADDNQGQAGHLIPQGCGGDVAPTINAAFGSKLGLDNQHIDSGAGLFVAHSLRGEGFDASEDGTGRGTPLVPVGITIHGTDKTATAASFTDLAGSLRTKPPGSIENSSTTAVMCFTAKDHGADAGAHSGSHANAGVMPAVAFVGSREVAGALTSNYGKQPDSSDTNLGPTLAVGSIAETMYGVSHADAQKTYPDQALRALRRAVGEKAYSKWSAGILTAFRTPEILQSAVHGGCFRRPADERNELGDDALSREEAGAAGAVFALWQAGCDGRTPRGWRPPEQLASELVAHLSELPHQRASAQRFLLGLWRASEGLGPLRQTLSALQEAWRPVEGGDADQEGVSGVRDDGARSGAVRDALHASQASAVRRLTPIECERLMGLPDNYTLVPYRNGMMADGPRYKMLGNSMAVPVVRWIGERIAMVDDLCAQLDRAA